jgi:hypothetical protein
MDKKIPNKWKTSCGLFIFGVVLTFLKRNQSNSFLNMSNLAQILIIFFVSLLVFIILHVRQRMHDKISKTP